MQKERKQEYESPVEESAKLAYQNLDRGLLICKPKGEIAFTPNSYLINKFGMPSKTPLSAEEYLQSSGQDSLAVFLKWVFSQAQPKKAQLHFSQGSIKWLIQSLPAQDYCLLVLTDLTETANLQANSDAVQLKRIESTLLEEMDRVTSGAAHEINNPLTILIGGISSIKRSASQQFLGHPKLDTLTAALEKLLVHCNRISNIVENLGEFSRSLTGKTEIKIVTAETVVQLALNFCNEQIKQSHIDLRLEINEISVSCRPAQLSRALLNLIFNAIDSVYLQSESQEGGRWIKIRALKDGQWVRFEVSDSGAGVPKEIEDQIMRPFFTTKEIGKGAGLGLSNSLSIAEHHQGRLFLDRMQSASTFVLEVPWKELK